MSLVTHSNEGGVSAFLVLRHADAHEIDGRVQHGLHDPAGPNHLLEDLSVRVVPDMFRNAIPEFRIPVYRAKFYRTGISIQFL